MGNRLSRYICFILMLFLCFVVLNRPAAAGTGFPDVPDNHWAAKHISKMNALKVTQGYEDGTFKPNQSVTQTEAVVMASRSVNKVIGYATSIPFKVPDWARQDVARALELGLLKNDETFSAQTEANRAWIVRLLVRMIDKELEALGTKIKPVFNDSYQIPDWASGYIKVAQDKNLVTGYDDNTFKPNRAVTRAELAVFLSRAQEYLQDSPSILKGRLVEIDYSRLTVNDAKGKKHTLAIPYGTPIYDDNGPLDINGLWAHDYVSLITDGENVKYLEKLPAEAIASIVSGNVQRIYFDEGALVLEVPEGEYRTYYLSPGTDSGDRIANEKLLDNLQPGDWVEVTLNAMGYISDIMIDSHSVGAYNEGIVYDLYREGDLITLQANNDKLSSYRLAEQVNVLADGRRFATLADVCKGDKVRLEIDNSIVMGIEILEVSSRLDLEGTIVSASSQEQIITMDVENQLKAFRVAAAAEVKIAGLTNAKLTDIVVGDRVKVRIENGTITMLEVKDRSITDSLYGTVVSVDTNNKIITLRDKKDSLHAYEIKNNARVIIDGKNTSLSKIKKDMQVDIRLVDEKIVYLAVDNAPEGIVVSLDDKSLLLVLADIDGRKATYVIDKDVYVYSRDARYRLEQIKRGDYVKLTLSDNVVTKIKLQTTRVLKVKDIDEYWNRIDAYDQDNKLIKLYISEGVRLEIPGTNYPNVDDLREKDIIKAWYYGDDLQKVELLPSRQGQVTAVDSYARTVTLRYSNGESATLNFDRNSALIIGNNRYDNLDRLKRGDYIKVIENLKGGYDLEVIYDSGY